MLKRYLLLIFLLLNLGQIMKAQAQETAKRRKPEFFFDATNPNVHDPAMAWEGDSCYVFATGMGIETMVSADGLKTWKQCRQVMKSPPQWAVDAVPGYRGHTWAPDIRKVGNRWYLYYSCSTFGRNRSSIGVAVNQTLDASSPLFHWEDLGLVIQSRPGRDDWNAIDPNLFVDEKGRAWLTFGSFWDGIQQVRLDTDLRTPRGKVRTVARRRNPEAYSHGTVEANSNAVEAPFLIYHEGYYYLFVSFDYCCKGLHSNYKTAVGRARKPNGPFRDKDGKKMLHGGGTLLVGGTERYAGIGHCGLCEHEGRWWFVAHGYDKQHGGQSKMVLKCLDFVEGWPVLVDP